MCFNGSCSWKGKKYLTYQLVDLGISARKQWELKNELIMKRLSSYIDKLKFQIYDTLIITQPYMYSLGSH